MKIYRNSHLGGCSKENLYWISEIFEDISEYFNSDKFIDCIEKLAVKYPELDLEYDIKFAKEIRKKSIL